MNDAPIYPYHPVVDYIRAQRRRTSWVWNNKVKCRVPNSDELADKLYAQSKRMSDRSARVELVQYSTREDVPARVKVYVRSIAFGKRGVDGRAMCRMFQSFLGGSRLLTTCWGTSVGVWAGMRSAC